MYPKRVSLLLIPLLLPVLALAHGVDLEPLEPVVAFQVHHEDEEPLGNARVEIFAPGENQEPFVSGKTDSLGRYAFFPICNGAWTVLVNDDAGHGLKDAIQVDESGVSHVDHHHGRGLSILDGLLVLMAISGFLYGWSARKRAGA